MKHRWFALCLLVLAGCSRVPQENSEARKATKLQQSAARAAAVTRVAELPFGIEIGSPPAAYKSVEGSHGVYEITPPKPDPPFQEFMVVTLPETGICLIRAVGPLTYNDATGAKVRATMNRLRDALTATYGPATRTFDECKRPGAICTARHWTENLHEFARVYRFEWRNVTRPQNRVAGIDLIASPGGEAGATFVQLVFYGDNWPTCDAAYTPPPGSIP